MNIRLSPIAVLLCSIAAVGGELAPEISALAAGQALPREFRIVTLPKVAKNNFTLVADEGKTALRVDSDNSAGSLYIPLTAPAADAAGVGSKAVLQWRWKVSRLLDKADMEDKLEDDHSARVYVFFDVPLASLSFTDRSKIKIARMVAGVDVPTAALCYVWDNKHRIGFKAWSPYTQRLRKIVLQSGPGHVGEWMTESRDVYADFREAFGFDAPAVTSIALGNDSDNTNERVTAWFGDISFRK